MKSYAKPEYDSSVKNFPAGLCSTCRYIIVLLISSYHSNFRINLNSCKKGLDWDSIGRTDPRIKWSNGVDSTGEKCVFLFKKSHT